MKKDIFGKWKKEEVNPGYDHNDQHAEGRMILERMASIISSDEASKKENKVDLEISPAAQHDEPPDGSEIPRTGKPGGDLNPETSEKYLLTLGESGSLIASLKANEVSICNRNESDIIGFHDNADPPKGSISDDFHATCSTGIKKKEMPSILVVEDEPVTQRLLKIILEDRGYTVAIAGDGIDALMSLGRGNFDLILSDLSMPNLDGFKLLDFINMKGIQTPIMFLTGSDNVEDEIKLLALGAKDYIRKPINRDLLLLRVSKALHP